MGGKTMYEQYLKNLLYLHPSGRNRQFPHNHLFSEHHICEGVIIAALLLVFIALAVMIGVSQLFLNTSMPYIPMFPYIY